MAKILYLDCFAGASGDMVLGALLDLGVPIDGLRAALDGIVPQTVEIGARRVSREGLDALQFTVSERAGGDGPHHHHRGLSAILALIESSRLDATVRRQAAALFERIGRVEADVHQVPVDRIHFHEIGAIDSLVDIVGSAWAFDQLGADRIVASPLNVGSGSVETAHGTLPVPAPATLKLLEGAPVYADGPPMERVTPTGALLVTAYASAFGPMPAMTVQRSGYGAGGRDTPGRPNVLRATVGEAPDAGIADRVVVIEANVDDMNPQLLGAAMAQLFACGAVDVYFTPVQMKKNRPGTLLTVIAPPDRRAAVTETLFRETTTIGVRYLEWSRECLARTSVTVETVFGPVRVKIATGGGTTLNASPEFEDCLAVSRAAGVPLKHVYADAVRAYRAAHLTEE